MDRETHALEAVADEAVLAAGNREDAVAAVAESVVRNGDVGRIPQRDAVAGLAEPAAAQAFDHVAGDPRTRGAMHVDAEQVSDQAVVLDRRAFGGLLEKNPGIHRLQIAARLPDGHAADRQRRARHRDDVAGAAAVEHGAGASSQYKRSIDPDRAVVFARGKLDDVTVARTIQQRLQRLVRHSRQRLRPGEAGQSGGDERRRKHA